MEPTPAFTLYRELRTRHARARLSAAFSWCLSRIIHRLLSFLKFGCLREGVKPIKPDTTLCEANVIYKGNLTRTRVWGVPTHQ